jgi:hypothetical protein
MSYGYSVSNLLLPIAPASITFLLSGGALSPASGSAAYLQDNRLDKRVVFPLEDLGADTLDIDIDMGAAVALQGVAILNHNFAKDGGCNCTIIASAAADYSGAVTPKAATPLTIVAMKDKDHVLQFPSVSRRYWRIRFSTGSGSFTPYIGEVFLFGAPVTLPRSSIYGSGESPQMFGAAMDFGNGNTSAYFLGGPVRQKDYQFADLSLSDLTAYQSLWLSQHGGFGSPFLWIEDIESASSAATAAAQECIFGRFLVPSYGYVQDDFGIFQPGSPFTIRSLGREVGA